MNIKITNSKGTEIRIGSKSDSLCLTEKPDWGTVPYVFTTTKLPLGDGEKFRGGRLGVRDIIIKFEARAADARMVFSTLRPGESVRLTIDGRWYIDGRINGILNANRLYSSIPLQMSVSVRCFDPYFYKVGEEIIVPFDNKRIYLYDSSGYLYQEFQVYNPGDVSCPVEMRFSVYYDSSTYSGVFTSALWNGGYPELKGFHIKNPEPGTEIYVHTEYEGNHADWYGIFRKPVLLQLEPGNNTLYAINCKGEVKIKPKYLSCEEGLCKDRY